MCGRYTLTRYDDLQIELGLAAPPAPGPPRYNIAPGQMVPIVANRPERVLTEARWGLVPYWADDPRIGNRMINARSESAAEKPAFRQALRRRRCLVVADGFYEWQRSPGDEGAGRGGAKVPHYVHRRSGAPFGMAGLWERWKAPDGTWLESCTVLTCDANALMRPIHARMPVILDRASHDRWLDPAPLAPEDLADLLRTPPANDFEAYRVSTLVNAPQNDVPACVEPAPQPSAPPAEASAAGPAARRSRRRREQPDPPVQPSLFDIDR